MKCWTAKRKISAYLDNSAQEQERLDLRVHLRDCEACSQTAEGHRRMRLALRSLTPRTPPPEFTEYVRVLGTLSLAQSTTRRGRIRSWAGRLKLALDNLMKPVALPAAGGLCAALLLFTSLVPNFSGAFRFGSLTDVPTGLSTGAAVKRLAPIGFQYGDAEVDLRIDDQGRIINYSIAGGHGLEKDALRRSIENNLLFTQFTPATAFGVPITGTLRLSFRSSRIDVKG
ncbi:MAG: anti-sigma factor family protein [Bryobacteraceae bacterium]